MQTYAQIQNQIEQLKAEAEKIRKDNMTAVIEQILALMKEHGVSLDDLNKAGIKERQTGVSTAKYRDPESGATWSGRGKQPAWFKNRIDAGESKESLLISK